MTTAPDIYSGERLDTRYVPLDEALTWGWEQNAKRSDVGLIAAAIQRYGFIDPPKFDPALNDGRGGYVYGNHRVQALGMLRDQGADLPRGILRENATGRWFVPIKFGVDAGSATEATAQALDHNNLTMAGGDFTPTEIAGMWDGETYAALLRDLQQQDALPTSVDADDLDALLADLLGDLDEGAGGDTYLPQPPREAKLCRTGDLWALGPHRLLIGDARSEDDCRRLLDGHQADLIWEDPPYNVNYVGKTKERLQIENDAMSDDAFLQFLVDVYTTGAALLKPGGAYYVAHSDQYTETFRQALRQSGFLVKQCLIWVKQSFVLGRQDYHWRHEPIVYGWKAGAGHYFTPDRTQDTVIGDAGNLKHKSKDELIEIIRQYRRMIADSVVEEDRPSVSVEHPTMKPLAVVARGVQNSTKGGQIVVDRFGGSGSTLITCHRTRRRCYTMDIDPCYGDVIVDRWIAETQIEPVLLERV